MIDNFSRDEYDETVPLHRIALAGLDAMQNHPDFNAEETHAIILLHTGELATVAPLNYPPGAAGVKPVMDDIAQHLIQLHSREDLRPKNRSNGGST